MTGLQLGLTDLPSDAEREPGPGQDGQAELEVRPQPQLGEVLQPGGGHRQPVRCAAEAVQFGRTEQPAYLWLTR